MKTGLITSDTSQNHDTGPGHPEQIARVSVIVENFKKLNNKNIIWKKPSKVSDDILLNISNQSSDYLFQTNDNHYILYKDLKANYKEIFGSNYDLVLMDQDWVGNKPKDNILIGSDFLFSFDKKRVTIN